MFERRLKVLLLILTLMTVGLIARAISTTAIAERFYIHAPGLLPG